MADIFQELRDQIIALVKKDGIDESYIQPNETKDDLVEYVTENIYQDVAGFYNWYFNQNDDRTNYLKPYPNPPDSLVTVVHAVVLDNLAAMKDADELPPDPDPDTVTQNLVGYILSWKGWVYDRKVDEEIDNYLAQAEDFNSIYVDSDYGDDIVGDIYDGSDLPYQNKL